MYGSKMTRAAIVLTGIAVWCALPAVADTLQEVHTLNYSVANPVFGTTFQYTLDFPLFDTQGGTRQLAGFKAEYNLYNSYTITYGTNPTQYWAGNFTSWTQKWIGTLNGVLTLPVDSGFMDHTRGSGMFEAPWTTVVPGPSSVSHEGIIHTEQQGPPSVLALMTGTGTVPLACTHTLSALTATMPDPRRWPPQAPVNLRIFDPNLITISLNEIGMDITITYSWDAVPEPSALALLSLGALTLLRRR
jgi:hypothetical protein